MIFKKISWKKNLDHWEYAFVKNRKQNVIPLSDIEAFKTYKHLRWVYDKYRLLKELNQSQVVLLSKELPPSYPAFCKPRTNFNGMGIGAKKVKNKKDLVLRKDLIAQEFHEKTSTINFKNRAKRLCSRPFLYAWIEIQWAGFRKEKSI